ncbi:hypothetical protein M413DRAFT_440353 [Hebeloma cylindrosporum]|uniref:Nuclear pore complex protein NUP96 C-terminal domain-containing protein n=1 Tax=Hebeloma cylindrosporum TaxID=76867 RepID=A0A0C2Z0U3_HEBCY|nr:hypothetical protein M413DRAFT_440353 [Hebeloma cylindrosporum h7]
MARFTAFASDESGSDDEREKSAEVKTPSKPPRRPPSPEEDEEEESSSSSSSEMQEDELLSSPPRRRRKPQHQDRNALVEDENGDVHYAHEVHVHVSPPSSTSQPSPPPKTRINARGDPTIIPWAQHVGVDAQKMHVMQTAFFRAPEEAAALKSLNEPTKTSRIRLEVHKNPKVNRKHSRDSEGDGLRLDSRERASFAQDIGPPVFRPSRKYARVGITSSIANGHEGAYVDAGLALGRSFRVGWGPSGQLVHLGSICGPMATTATSANTSSITLTKTLPTLCIPQPDPTAPSPLPTHSALSAKLLQHHLSHTTISRDDSGIPRAYPTTPTATTSASTRSTWTHAPASSSDPLNFSSFVTLFPTTETSSLAPIFRLGSALFDPLPHQLGRPKSTSEIFSNTVVTPDLTNRVSILRRKAALSKWLEETVKPSVDSDLRVQSSGSTATYTPADAAFTHLSGHQISEACSAAADGGYIKLSTLISQAGGDELFKEDILAQLEIWKSEKLSPGSSNHPSAQNGLIGRGVWRIYRLLSGPVQPEGSDSSQADDVFAGLDWKRVFGLCLWYGSSVDASVADVVNAYERVLLHNSKGTSHEVARPIPRWAAKTISHHPHATSVGAYTGVSRANDTVPQDPLYVLIRLHADPALSLTNALNPLSFAPSGLDWGIAMCWHLYIILSRVMGVRDFADRSASTIRSKPSTKGRKSQVNGIRSRSSLDGRVREAEEEDDEIRIEGHSPSADLLAAGYAFELESWGMIQEAAFVLLHLEEVSGSCSFDNLVWLLYSSPQSRREKAIKELLARSAPRLNDWMTHGLVGSLKLPMAWLDEAKAMYELDSGYVYAAYELYLSAKSYNLAHNLAQVELAPDAIIRKDLELLRNLFKPFDADGKRDKIVGWFVRGKVFLDYVHTMTRLPKLLDDVAAENEEAEAMPDAARSQEIETLSKQIPRLIAMLPDILHRNRATDPRHVAALEEMTKDLLKLVERAQPLLLSQIQQPTLAVLDGATKINLVRGIGYARFLQSIEA